MTDGDALVAAIRAAPEDDAPRLVFADWLDEHGQAERAEFIRIQVAMRREHEAHGRTDRLERLFVRSREVFYRPWAEPVRAAFGRGVGLYSRGFPRFQSSLYLTAAQAVTDLPALASWMGPDTDLTLRDGGGRLTDVAGVRELRLVQHLHVAPPREDAEPVTDADVVALLASPHLAELRSLGLAQLRLSDAVAQAVARAAGLTRLERLNLDDNRIGRAGALALSGASHLRSLRRLSLANNRLGNGAVRALLQSPHLAGLTGLELQGNRHKGAVAEVFRQRFPTEPVDEIPF